MSDPGLTLLGEPEHETRLLRDDRCGFTVPVPGHPRAEAPPRTPPRLDLVVQLEDAPVTLGFRLDDIGGDLDPDALAATLATAWVAQRATRENPVHALPASLRGQGVEAAASAIFPLPGAPVQMEQVTVFVRRPWAMVRAVRFAPAELNALAWSHIRWAMAGTVHWDPDAPRDAAPAVWPADSAFAEPGVGLRLLASQRDALDRKQAALETLSREDGRTLVQLMLQVADATPYGPSQPVSSFELNHLRLRLRGALADTDAADALAENLDEVATAHDLRAWAWQNVVAWDRAASARH